ncbi:asparagine-rich protein [Cryptosporidium ryanae]|uniref:asparagine-rich protein n=1 Tax=Cryptosporidium ryanae TaxID=515981 RepID=UPI003519E00E|nr:asparagine-rich protein [Cryptosporidium ryanae]
MFEENFRPCFNGYTTGYRQNIGNLPRLSHLPFNGVTGTLLGGTLTDSRYNDSSQNVRLEIGIDRTGLRPIQSFHLVRNSNTSNQRNNQYDVNGDESIFMNDYLVSNGYRRTHENFTPLNLNRVGQNALNLSNSEIRGYNRSNLNENHIRMIYYTPTEYRIVNRSISMSSPNLNERLNRTVSSNQLIENNVNLINRSRSFADRILEQFETIEREHNDLTERIQRSQSLYGLIQRNNEEVNRVLGSISERSERRLSQRSNNNIELSMRSRSELLGSNRESLSNEFETTNIGNSCTNNINRINRTESTGNDILSSFEQLNEQCYRNSRRGIEISMDEIQVERIDNEDITYHNNDESDADNEDVLEMVHIDEEFERYLDRRNEEIRNRSLILSRDEITFEDDIDEEEELIVAGFDDNYPDEFGYSHENENCPVLETNYDINSHNNESIETEVEYEVDENNNTQEIRGISVNTVHFGENVERIRLEEMNATFLSERPASISERLLETSRGSSSYTDNISNVNRVGRRNKVCVPTEIQNAFPVSKYDEKKSQNLDEDKKTCLICLENFKDKQEILWLPCTHCFCKCCITSWFNRGAVCPICKDDILSHF